MTSSNDARFSYDAASEHFDDAPLRFWTRYGERTVAQLELRPGARVLDVCSGTGGSALPAARAVGPNGSVTCVDLSQRLLDLAKRKAQREGLHNLEFRVGDMKRLDLPEASFDAVIIVFGIFFAPDMLAQLRVLTRLLRPGGVLAVTTWGPRMFEPLYSAFLESVRVRRAGLSEYRPWDRLTTPENVAALISEAGFEHLAVRAEPGREILDRPEDWWTIALGTGLRWFIDQLDASSAEAVHAESLARASEVRFVETNVIYAVAHK
jgi:ubiquinone/menaquinone biosynthesis C-methylase UbiE